MSKTDPKPLTEEEEGGPLTAEGAENIVDGWRNAMATEVDISYAYDVGMVLIRAIDAERERRREADKSYGELREGYWTLKRELLDNLNSAEARAERYRSQLAGMPCPSRTTRWKDGIDVEVTCGTCATCLARKGE